MNGFLVIPAAGVPALPLLADLTIKATLLLVLAAAIVFLMRRASAAFRHLVWTLGIVGVLLLPLLSWLAPRWRVPGIAPVRVAAPTAPVLAAATPIVPADPVAVSPTPTVPTASPATRTAPRAIPLPQVSPQRSGAAPAPTSSRAPETGWETPPGTTGSTAPAPFTAIVWLWLGGVALFGTGLAVSVLRNRLLARRARPVGDERRTALAGRLARMLGIRRHVRLVEVARPTSPMTWGVARPVVLLPAESDAWSRGRLQSVLLHELAHVRRHDYLTQLLAHVMCAVNWFNPLAWYAARRMHEERELACDDVVLARGTRPSEYARHLLDIARALRRQMLPTATAVCMTRRSSLRSRLLAVLDPSRVRAALSRRLALPAAGTALAIVLPLAGAVPDSVEGDAPVDRSYEQSTPGPATTVPAAKRVRPKAPISTTIPAMGAAARTTPVSPRITQSQACNWDTRSEDMSSSTQVNDRTWRIRLSIDRCEIRVDAEGEVRFTDDDRDVASLARGAHFTIEEVEGRARRRMEFRPTRGDAIERRWFVDGREQWSITGDLRAHDPAAAQWLARTLLVVFRRAGLNAEARATRIFQRGGVDSLLAEVATIQSGWAASKYYAVLLSQPNLDGAIVLRVVRDAGRRIESDHTLATLLLTIAEHQPLDGPIRTAFVEAAGSLESDHQQTRVLMAILQRPGITRDLADAMLRSSTNIGSDHQRAELLLAVVQAHPLDETLRESFFDALRGIGSDYNQARVLNAILERGTPSVDLLDRTLTLASNLQSDHQLAELLIRVATLYPMDGALPASYLQATQTLSSSYNLGRVLRAFVDRETITDAALASVLDAASAISSDHELGSLLQRTVERGRLTPGVRPAFFRALSSIDSDHAHSNVLSKIIADQPLDDALAVLILRSAAGDIESDHALGTVLIELAEKYGVPDALRDEFMRAVDAIESEHTRGRVLNAMYPRGRPA